MNRKKYCCLQFEYRHRAISTMGLNIRVIKLSKEFVIRGGFSGNLYRYLICDSYEKLNLEVKTMMINFCPHCGSRLSDFYNSDIFINEETHEF